MIGQFRTLSFVRAGMLVCSLTVGGVVSTAAGQDTSRVPARNAPMSRPDVVRGLYVNRWAVLDGRVWNLIAVARTTEVNALVIDVKDDRGYVLYPSSVPLVGRIGADTTNPVPVASVRAMLDTMRAHDIYPIARIVVAKDPLLASAMKEWAVHRRSDSTAWLDHDGKPWLDPHQRGIWSYAADIAAEAVQLGFREVQFDYVRFPDDPQLPLEARFPLASGRRPDRVIGEQLAFLRGCVTRLHVPMAIDVFGLTTSDTTDMGIGQRWEEFGEVTDVVLPMTYPSHYSAGMYGLPNPNAAPYETIDRALRDAKARNARLIHPPIIVPWYQDFTLGDPPYGVAQIRAQMQAGYDNGIRSWMLWNASSTYTVEALAPAIRSAEEEAIPVRKP